MRALTTAQRRRVATLEAFVRSHPGIDRKAAAVALGQGMCSSDALQLIAKAVAHRVIRQEWDPGGTYRLYPIIPFGDEAWIIAEIATRDLGILIEIATLVLQERMKAYIAKEPGRYIVQTVEGRAITIHASEWLDVGEHVLYPEGAFVLHVVAEPESKEPR